MSQAQMAYKMQLDDKEERDKLIMSELPQVYYIARRIHERLPQHVPLEDLVHAGVIGLIGAVRSYDPSKQVPLKAYTKFRIRGAIIDSLRELDWGSRRLRYKGRRIEEAITKLANQLGRQPQEDEIAAELNISIDELFSTLQKIDGVNLVGQQVNAAYDSSETQDLIESAPSNDESPLELRMRSELQEKLSEAISTLSEKEQMVISLYYREELTMKEIAKVMQLGESRISQLHSMALPKLRAALKAANFNESDFPF